MTVVINSSSMRASRAMIAARASPRARGAEAAIRSSSRMASSRWRCSGGEDVPGPRTFASRAMMRSTWAARAGFRAPLRYPRASIRTHRPPGASRRTHRGHPLRRTRSGTAGSRPARFEPRATAIDALERNFEGHAGDSPAGYELECRTNDANQVTVIPLAQVPLHLPGGIRGIVHAC